MPSENSFFKRSDNLLLEDRYNLIVLLQIKKYSNSWIAGIIEAYDYFCIHKDKFDGATAVEDFYNYSNLDISALVHDYVYLKFKVESNFKYKNIADKLYARMMKRFGMLTIVSQIEYAGLFLSGIVRIPKAIFKQGKMSEKDKQDFITYTNNFK